MLNLCTFFFPKISIKWQVGSQNEVLNGLVDFFSKNLYQMTSSTVSKIKGLNTRSTRSYNRVMRVIIKLINRFYVVTFLQIRHLSFCKHFFYFNEGDFFLSNMILTLAMISRVMNSEKHGRDCIVYIHSSTKCKSEISCNIVATLFVDCSMN